MSDKIKANEYSEMAFVSNVDFLLILSHKFSIVTHSAALQYEIL